MFNGIGQSSSEKFDMEREKKKELHFCQSSKCIFWTYDK